MIASRRGRACVLYVVNFITAALTCAALLAALGWPHTPAEGALACAVVALVAVALLYTIGPEWLASWHRRRSRSLFAKQAEISSIWPLAVICWLWIIIREASHTKIAGWLS